MRILEIELKNIGNMEGKHSIDLSGSAYPPHGVSYISREKGLAFLDAVCLSFYGKHFNHKSILSDKAEKAPENNVLSSIHNSSAYVLFEVGPEKTRYSAEWIYAEPDSINNIPVRKIYRVNSDSTTQTEDNSLTFESITGLSFDSFVRSLFLPQRDYLAFLDSEGDSASVIFEKLTGKAIYNDILRFAFKTSSLKHINNSVIPKGQDEKSHIELKEKLQAAIEIEHELAEITKELDLHAEFSITKNELDSMEKERQRLEKELALSASDRRRLEQGEKTLELRELYTSLSKLRRELETDKIAQLNIMAEMPRERGMMKSAEEALELAETQFRDKLSSQKKLEETVRAVREIDVRIKEKKDLTEEIQSDLQDAKKHLQEATFQNEAKQKELEKIGVALRDVRKFLQVNASDEKLLQGIGNIKKCFELLGSALDKQKILKADYSEAIQKKQHAQTALNDRQAMFSEINLQLMAAEKNFSKAQEQSESILSGKTISELRNEVEALQRSLFQADLLHEKLEQQESIIAKQRTLLDNRLALETIKKELLFKETELDKLLGQEREKLSLLEDRILLLQHAKGLESVRHALHHGVPCPLCGSPTHPYQLNSTLITDNVELEHEQAKINLSKISSDLTLLRNKIAEAANDIKSIEQNELNLQEELLPLAQAISEKSATLNLRFSIGIPPLEEFKRFKIKTQESFLKSKAILELAEKAVENLNISRNELEKTKVYHEELTCFLQEAMFHLKSEQNKADSLEKEIRSHEESLNTIRRDLTSQISYYGYKHIPDDKPENLLITLEERAESWKEHSAAKEELEKQACVLEAQLNFLQLQVKKLTLELHSKSNLLKSTEAEHDAFQHQRVGLFASRDPDQEEASTRNTVEEARSLVKAKQALFEEARIRLDTITKRQHELETNLAKKRDLIQKEEISFGKKLLANDFKNENDYLSACLSVEERIDIQGKIQTLSKEDLELNAQYMDKKFFLGELQSKKTSNQDIKELQKCCVYSIGRLAGLYADIYDLLKSMESNETEQFYELFYSKKRLSSPGAYAWINKLDETHEGMGFRKLAQSFILDNLVACANLAFKEMSWGYVLKRVHGEFWGLELVSATQSAIGHHISLWNETEKALVSAAFSLSLARNISHKISQEVFFAEGCLNDLEEAERENALTAISNLCFKNEVLLVF